MRRFKVIALAVCLLLSPLVVGASAQKPVEKKDRLTPIQQIAVETAEGTLNELRQVEDLTARIELSGEVVELLKSRRPARCRQVLDELFATALDAKPEGISKGGVGQTRGSIIRRVIQVAASFDRALASSYADMYEEAERLALGPDAPPDATQRATAEISLALAADLVEKDAALAASVAERSLPAGVTQGTLVFLEKLRQRDARAADRFFAAVMRSVVARQGVDVNELLLLYSYVFSVPEVPHILPQGLVRTQLPAYQQAFKKRAADPAAVRLYLHNALLMLSDPNRYTTGGGSATADLVFVKLIETQVLTYLPAKAEALAGLQYALVAASDPERRASLQSAVDRWNGDAKAGQQPAGGVAAQSFDATLRQIDQMEESPQKDFAAYSAAVAAVNDRNYEGALRLVEKLSPAAREAAKQFIVFQIAESNFKDERYAEAERWARLDGDAVRRACVFSQVANALAANGGGEIVKVLELLSEVERISAKVEVDREQASVLLGGALAYSRFDRGRAFALLGRAIEAANKGDSFDRGVYRELTVGDFNLSYSLNGGQPALAKVIGELGPTDFYQALGAVQGLKGRVSRLKTTLALCRSVITRAVA